MISKNKKIISISLAFITLAIIFPLIALATPGDLPSGCASIYTGENGLEAGELLDTAGTQSNDEVMELICSPQPRINIPGLSFTSEDDLSSLVQQVDDGNTYFYIPFLGQYLAAVYKYSVAVASIIAVIVIIVAGIQRTTSAGSPEAIQKSKDRITGAVIGLILALGSYTILYTLNPSLVQFKNLKVLYNAGVPLTMPADDEEYYSNQSVPATPVTMTERSFIVNDLENFCFPVSDGFDNDSRNWGQARKVDTANDRYLRCHSGLDLNTHGAERIVGTVHSMTEGVVKNISNSFTTCCDGFSSDSNPGQCINVGAITIYDEAHDKTYVYGEVNNDTIRVSEDQEVDKGQILGTASKCKMLHLEIYDGSRRQIGQEGQVNGINERGWYVYDQFGLPDLERSRDACRDSRYLAILDQIGSTLLDPQPFIDQIKNTSCINFR